MVTAEQEKLAARKITHWVDNDRQIVTYRTVAREIACHVNTAKNILLKHYQANPSLTPTYVLSGNLLPSSSLTQTIFAPTQSTPAGKSFRDLGRGMVKIVDMDERSDAGSDYDESQLQESMDDVPEAEAMGNDRGAEVGDGGIGGGGRFGSDGLWKEQVQRWGVILASAEVLEEKKLLFEQEGLSVHIHSLAPAPVTDPAHFLIPNLLLHENPKLFDPLVYGSFTGEAFKPSSKVTKSAPLKVGAKKSASAVITSAAAKGKSGKVEPKMEVKAEAKDKLTPLRSSTSNKRVIQSDTEDEEPAPDTKSKPNVKVTTTSGGERTSKMTLEPTSSVAAREDQAALEAMAGMDMDFSDDEEDQKVKKDIKVQKPLRKSKTGRKMRRVKRTKREKDAKGFYVSKDYYTDESYDTSDTETAQKQTAKPAVTNKPSIKPQASGSSVGSNAGSKPIGGNVAGKKPASSTTAGQSSLKGFFKKK